MPNNKEPQAKEVGVRYVTVKDVTQIYDISERTLLRWVKNDKIIRTIRDIKNHIRMDLADVERVMKNRNVPPNPLYQELQILQTRVGHLEQQVVGLRAEMEDQRGSGEQLLQALAVKLTPGEADAHTSSHLFQQIAQAMAGVHRLRARAGSGEEEILRKRGLPSGTIRLVNFAEQHGVKVWDLKKLHWAGNIQLEVYQREEDATRNKQEWWVTQEQHQQVSAYCQQHEIPYTPCRQCEH
jgi:hypothetical protein